MRGRIFRVELMVFVVRRMSGLLQLEKIKARPVHGALQLPAHHEHGIPKLLSLQAATVHAPQQAVAGIYNRAPPVPGRGLPVGAAGHDQSMERLEGLISITKFTGQPIQELRVRRKLAHAAEVVG